MLPRFNGDTLLIANVMPIRRSPLISNDGFNAMNLLQLATDVVLRF